MTYEEKIDRQKRSRWYNRQAKLASKKSLKYVLRQLIRLKYGKN